MVLLDFGPLASQQSHSYEGTALEPLFTGVMACMYHMEDTKQNTLVQQTPGFKSVVQKSLVTWKTCAMVLPVAVDAEDSFRQIDAAIQTIMAMTRLPLSSQ